MTLLDRWQARVLGLASWLVPKDERDDWRREWDGELAALGERVDGWPTQRRRLARSALWVALNDALWLRLHPRHPRSRRPLRRRPLTLHPVPEGPPHGGGPSLWNDVVFGLRRLRRAPGFAAMVVVFLGLSIASTTTVFSFVRAIVLEPLAYSEADRLVRVLGFEPTQGQEDWLSMTEVLMLEEEASSLEAVAHSTVFPASLTTPDGRTRVQRGFVSPNYFELLGVPAHHGRLLRGDDGDLSAVVLGYDYWRRHWQGDRSIVGQRLTVDDAPYTVVGIASPETYTHDFSVTPADLWLRLPPPRADDDLDFRIFTALARLDVDHSLDAARAELFGLQERLATRRPDVYGGWQLAVRPLKETVVGGSGRPLLLIFAALGLLALAICANLASLVTARLLGRRSELAIHLALGGRSSAIARQLAIEGLLLSLVGGLLGLALASWALGMRPLWEVLDLPRAAEVQLGWPALVFALLATVSMTLLFSWLPALFTMRAGARDHGLAQRLRSSGRWNSSRVGWMRNGLIVAQVAIALPLLVGAGLLTRSLLELRHTDLGYHPEALVGVRVSLPLERSTPLTRRAEAFESILTELRGLPGVEGAAATLQMPLVLEQQDRTRFSIVGRHDPDDGERPRALYQLVSPGYFDTLGTRLLAGRDFDSRDHGENEPVVLISEALARRHFPDRSPLGERLDLELQLVDETTTRTIVGVIADLSQLGPAATVEPMVFVPHAQVGWPSMGIVVRLTGPLAPVLEGLRSDLAEREPRAIVEPPRAFTDRLDALLGPYRTSAILVAALALFTAALGLLGLYGLLSYDVAQTGREIAIRMALGASRRTIRWRLLTRATLLVASGSLLGTLLALWLVRLLRSVVHGLPTVAASDLVALAVTLALTTCLASWLPAVRAGRIAPAETLRGE